MYDLHSHILWGIDDDGPQTLNQSLRLAKIAAGEGIRAMVATPHFMIDIAEFDIEDIEKRVQAFKAELHRQGIQLDILPGAELYLDRRLPDILIKNRLTIAGTRYVLLELPMHELPDYTEDLVKVFLSRDMVPIIAHPERNVAISQNPNLMYNLVNLGALGQLTAGSITGSFGRRLQGVARILIEHNMVHILAGDAHSHTGRPPRMAKAAAVIEEMMGSRVRKAMTKEIPRLILSDARQIKVEPPVVYKGKKSIFDFFKSKK